MGAKSNSPKRSDSPKRGKGPTQDDILLQQRVSANTVDVPTTQFYALGGAISVIPVYAAVYIFELTFTVTNCALFALVCGLVTKCLQEAYSIMFFAEFMRNDKSHTDIKNQKDANLLRQMRLEWSMARAVWQINAFFVLLSTFLQLYVFKKMDPRASFFLGPLIAGLVSWFVGYKSEETRKAKAANRHEAN